MEGTHHSTVANLDGLQHVQHQLSTLAREEESLASHGGGAVDLIGQVDGLHRGGQVGDHTGHAEVESLLGNLRQAEGVLDDFLSNR